MQVKQIDHLPEVCKYSSLFVDPNSRAIISSAAKPWRASGNEKKVHAYPNVN